jgi:hypothetical protein
MMMDDDECGAIGGMLGTLCTTNPLLPEQGSNPSRRDGKSVTNRLINDTAALVLGWILFWPKRNNINYIDGYSHLNLGICMDLDLFFPGMNENMKMFANSRYCQGSGLRGLGIGSNRRADNTKEPHISHILCTIVSSCQV